MTMQDFQRRQPTQVPRRRLPYGGRLTVVKAVVTGVGTLPFFQPGQGCSDWVKVVVPKQDLQRREPT